MKKTNLLETHVDSVGRVTTKLTAAAIQKFAENMIETDHPNAYAYKQKDIIKKDGKQHKKNIRDIKKRLAARKEYRKKYGLDASVNVWDYDVEHDVDPKKSRSEEFEFQEIYDSVLKIVREDK
jgi:hypothetical protein